MIRSTILPRAARLTPMLGRPMAAVAPWTTATTTTKDHCHDDQNNDDTVAESSLSDPRIGATRSFGLAAPKHQFKGGRRSFRSSAVVRKSSSPTVPDMATAQAMPLSLEQMDNTTLVTLGAMGEASALEEMLKRHIMTVDNVSYETACETFEGIEKVNGEGLYLLKFPYQVGIATALIAGFASFPLVFDLGTAEWFNQNYVTTDVPESEDLETVLEVGAWTWNWMEPPLGQVSFFLLCLQFSRAQMDNLGVKPYTTRVKQMRAQHLADLYTQYDKKLIMDYSMSRHILGS